MLFSSGKIANNPNVGHSNGERREFYVKAPRRKHHGHLEAPGPGGDVGKAVRPRACQTGCRVHVSVRAQNTPNTTRSCFGTPLLHDTTAEATQQPEEPPDSPPSASHTGGTGGPCFVGPGVIKGFSRGRAASMSIRAKGGMATSGQAPASAVLPTVPLHPAQPPGASGGQQTHIVCQASPLSTLQP